MPGLQLIKTPPKLEFDMDEPTFTVLVVEDDEEMNSLECEFLGVHGMETLQAFTGSQAVETCAIRKVDAVLLDVMLPRKDGFETCRELRHRVGAKLPIIMLTALEDHDCRRRGMEAGASAYFSKPFDPTEVVGKLQELLS